MFLTFSGMHASSRIPINLSTACRLLSSCVLDSCEFNVNSSLEFMYVIFRDRIRAFISSGIQLVYFPDERGNFNVTFVFTLFTFWPPAPEDFEKERE